MRLTLALLLAPSLALAHEGPHDCAPLRAPILGDAATLPVEVPTLLYLGFAGCTDVCPVDVSRNHEAVTLAEAAGHPAHNLMVSVDPWETEALLDLYAANWPGTEARPHDRALMDAVRATATPREGDPDLWDHSTLTYLVLPGVGIVQLLPRSLEPEAVAEALMCQRPGEPAPQAGPVVEQGALP